MNAPLSRRRFGGLLGKFACLCALLPLRRAARGQDKPEPKPTVIAACGPLCALILVLIILGVAVYMTIQLIKWCKKLNRKQEKPDDPNSGGNFPPGPAVVKRASFMKASGPAFDMGDACPPSWDITEWATLGTDGVPNSPYHDGEGFPYCVEFQFQIHAAESLAGPWTPLYYVVGFVSFASTAALQWTDGPGYAQSMAQYPPKNIRLKWFAGGTAPGNLKAVTYGPVNGEQPLTVPPELLGNNPARFFRACYQQ